MYICNDPVCDPVCDFCWFCKHDENGIPKCCTTKEAMKNGNIEQAEKLMNQVINSMGAFIDAQLILSNLPGNISFVKSKDIIKSYIARLQENSEVSDSEKDYLIDSMKEIMNSIE
jgi:hypothetical protein